MNIKAWNALLVIALLIVLGGGGYILYQSDVQKREEIAQEQAEIAAAAQVEVERLEAARQARLQGFEDFLNDFLREVSVQARAYKKSRAVLNELGKPSNLSEPQYIEENARLAENTVMSLQLKMDDIMSIFTRADQQAQDFIAQFEEDAQVGVQESWSSVRDENAEKYTSFFAAEQDLLMAQLKLIEFYSAQSAALSVDAEHERVLFESVELQEEEALLRGAIIELKAVQKDAVRASQGGN